MHTAARIDFARPHGGSDARFLVLALASGIAGLTISYPTITLGNATVGQWAGRFEARPTRLAMAEILPATSVTATFHGAAELAALRTAAAAAGLTEAFASPKQVEPRPKANAGPESVPTRLAARPALSMSSASSASPVTSGRGYASAVRTPVTEHAIAAAGPVTPLAPLDAVRIVLPPAASALNTAGVLPSPATLDTVALARPSTAPEAPALAASAGLQASSVSAPAPADARPFALLSAPKEVQEFDLASLGASKTFSNDLVRSAASALATAKPAARARDLSKVARVPDRIVGDYIVHVAELSLEGVPSGNLSVRIGMNGNLSIKLADLLAPVQDQMAPEAFQRLANSSAASEYVSFAQLRAAGFDIRYDAGIDRLTVSAQP